MKANQPTPYRELIYEDSKAIATAKAEILTYVEDLNLAYSYFPFTNYLGLWEKSYGAHELVQSPWVNRQDADRLRRFLQNPTNRFFSCLKLKDKWEIVPEAFEAFLEREGLKIYTKTESDIKRLRFAEGVCSLANFYRWPSFSGGCIVRTDMDSITDKAIQDRQWTIGYRWVIDTFLQDNAEGIEKYNSIQDSKARTNYLTNYLSGALAF